MIPAPGDAGDAAADAAGESHGRQRGRRGVSHARVGDAVAGRGGLDLPV